MGAQNILGTGDECEVFGDPPEWMIEHGYEKARRIGVVAMIGGKDKTGEAQRDPDAARDVLIEIARKAHNGELATRPAQNELSRNA